MDGITVVYSQDVALYNDCKQVVVTDIDTIDLGNKYMDHVVRNLIYPRMTEEEIMVEVRFMICTYCILQVGVGHNNYAFLTKNILNNEKKVPHKIYFVDTQRIYPRVDTHNIIWLAYAALACMFLISWLAQM
jgi:hypothetical protein